MISGNLFTRDYLLEGIERTDQWKHLDHNGLAPLNQRLTTIAQKFLKIAKPNEAETEKEFIYPVLEALGWADYQVQQILSPKGRKQVPDALLFANSAAKSLCLLPRRSSGSASNTVWLLLKPSGGLAPSIGPISAIRVKRASPPRRCFAIPQPGRYPDQQ